MEIHLTNKQIRDLKNVHKIQGSHGNWDYDPYMLGLYNGLEMAMSIVEERDPDFRSYPEVWITERIPVRGREQRPATETSEPSPR